jgi:hypothetical protein
MWDYHWIVAVDGNPTDIRMSCDLAIRQGKRRKADNPDKVVSLHYGYASAHTYHDGKRLVVDIVAPDLSDKSLMAYILP